MKYFRHPPLAFWTIVLAMLAALVFFGLKTGSENINNLNTTYQKVEDERPYAQAMLTRISQIKAVMVSPEENLNAWAQKTADMALENAKRRASSSGDKDPAALAYANIYSVSDKLAKVDAENREEILALQAELGVGHDRLIAAVGANVLVPGLPGSPESFTGAEGGTQTDSTIVLGEK